ncbi:ABC transporter transmembrane domain-containing protein [Candidatus Paracaedibacter symbiosus]|uniref:ABC transporter transmembrane domain-containing protein n=1 Tax=Candidatus Paracaedibacter symbiosus TaxID=244582 RepID=UPI0006924F81|nr:ABC transporter transmembrane domain-containing protein [Candidatus Paracaedibacter symbiosus]
MYAIRSYYARRGAIHIIDPSSGQREINAADVSSNFTGVALELHRGPKFVRQKEPSPISLLKLIGSVEGIFRALLVLCVMAFSLEIFALLAPQFTRIIVDDVISGGDAEFLTVIISGFAIVILIQTILSSWRTWVVVWLSANIGVNWSSNVFNRLMSLPQDYFSKRHIGDIVSRFGAVHIIQQTLSTRFAEAILDGLMASLTIAIVLWYSSSIALAVLSGLTLYAIIRVVYFRVLKEKNVNLIELEARRETMFLESVRGVQSLRLFNRSAMQIARYVNQNTDATNASVQVQRLTIGFDAVSNAVSGAVRISVLAIGAKMAMSGGFSAGVIVALVAYVDQFSNRVIKLINYLLDLKLVRIQVERLGDILLTEPEKDVTASSSVLIESPPSLKFKNVSFRYGDNEPWVLQDCSFEVACGEIVALAGPSGGGKSTRITSYNVCYTKLLRLSKQGAT